MRHASPLSAVVARALQLSLATSLACCDIQRSMQAPFAQSVGLDGHPHSIL